jgi:hypothetical protein
MKDFALLFFLAATASFGVLAEENNKSLASTLEI